MVMNHPSAMNPGIYSQNASMNMGQHYGQQMRDDVGNEFQMYEQRQFNYQNYPKMPLHAPMKNMDLLNVNTNIKDRNSGIYDTPSFQNHAKAQQISQPYANNLL